MSIEPGTTLPKQIVLRNDPSERNFAATWRLMQERRRLCGIDPTNFRPRRKSSVVGITPIEPPVKSEEPILRPVSVATIDSDLEDTEPVPLEPEVGAPVIVEAGADDEEESEIDDAESGESGIEQTEVEL